MFVALNKGYAVAQLVETQRYKPEGRGLDSRWGSTQPLTEMSTRNISWGGGGGLKAAGT